MSRLDDLRKGFEIGAFEIDELEENDRKSLIGDFRSQGIVNEQEFKQLTAPKDVRLFSDVVGGKIDKATLTPEQRSSVQSRAKKLGITGLLPDVTPKVSPLGKAKGFGAAIAEGIVQPFESISKFAEKGFAGAERLVSEPVAPIQLKGLRMKGEEAKPLTLREPVGQRELRGVGQEVLGFGEELAGATRAGAQKITEPLRRVQAETLTTPTEQILAGIAKVPGQVAITSGIGTSTGLGAAGGFIPSAIGGQLEEAEQRGIDEKLGTGRALTLGSLEGLWESAIFGKATKAIPKLLGASKATAKLPEIARIAAEAGGGEFAEETASQIAEFLFDKALVDPDTEFDVMETLKQSTIAGIGAILTVGIGSGIQSAKTYQAKVDAGQTPTPQETQAMIKDVEQATGKTFKDFLTQEQIEKVKPEVKPNIINQQIAQNQMLAEGETTKVEQPESQTLLKQAQKYDNLQEFVDDNVEVPEYAMQHRPTVTMATADNISQEASDMGIPDFYQHPEYYDFGGEAYSESIDVLMDIAGNPEAEITIYRASPYDELNIGDWIALSKEKALMEMENENTPIHEFKVKAKDIQFAGDDITEFGYYPDKDIQKFKEAFEKSQKGIQPTQPKVTPELDIQQIQQRVTPARTLLPLQQRTEATQPTLPLTEVQTQSEQIQQPIQAQQEVIQSETTELQKGEDIQKVEFTTPEINKRYESAKGIPVKGIIQKAKEYFSDIGKKATRQFKELPLTEQNAEAIKDINLMLKSKQKGGAETTRILTDITQELTPNEADLFTKKVLVDDLSFDAKDDKQLPLGFNADNITIEQQNIDKNLTPNVQKAIEKRNSNWNNIKTQYANAMAKLGIDTEGRFSKPNYFRHQVLKYLNETSGIKGIGKKAGIKKRGFTKERKGTTQDINTNYIQAEYEVMAQMLADIETAKRLGNIQQKYDLTNDLKEQFGDDYSNNIPEGYVEFAPSGENVFLNKNIEDNIQTLTEEVADQLGIDRIKLKPQRTMIIPEGIASTLSDLGTPKEKSLLRKGITVWKRLMLTDIPTKLLRYNARNMAGDADAVIAGRAGTFKKVPQAIKDISNATLKNEYSEDFQEFIDRGGDQITFIANELQDLSKAPEFKKFFKKPDGILDKGVDLAKKPFKAYREFADSFTNNREMIFRYAAYLQFKQEMQQNKNGLPNDFVMSNPEAIKGLSTIEDRAFKMSNDMLGNYDEITELGKEIREGAVPFYSFTEANAKRYINLFKNAWTDPQSQLKAGEAVAKNAKVAGVLSAKALRKLGTVALKAYAFTGLTTLWNNIFFRDEEDDLPPDVKERPHLIFGRDKNGKVQYFSRLGSLNEALEVIGLDTASQDVIDVLNGNKTLTDVAKQVVLAPAKKVIGSVGPQYKLPFELLSGQSLYPDPFTPRRIRDKGEQIARTFGVDSTYRLLTGKPSEGYLKELVKKSLLYSADPDQTSYWKTKALVDKFNEEKTGQKRTGGFGNKKSDALYEVKKAIRFKDDKAQEKFMRKYIEAGGTEKGIEASLKSLDPLYSLAKKNIYEFKKTLSPEEKKDLAKAEKYNTQVLKGLSKTGITPLQKAELKKLQLKFRKLKGVMNLDKPKQAKRSILPLLTK